MTKFTVTASAAIRPRFFTGLDFSPDGGRVLWLQLCNFDHGFLFVGRVGVWLSLGGAGFHLPGGGPSMIVGVGWWSGVDRVIGPGPVRAQVKPSFALPAGEAGG